MKILIIILLILSPYISFASSLTMPCNGKDIRINMTHIEYIILKNNVLIIKDYNKIKKLYCSTNELKKIHRIIEHRINSRVYSPRK